MVILAGLLTGDGLMLAAAWSRGYAWIMRYFSWISALFILAACDSGHQRVKVTIDFFSVPAVAGTGVNLTTVAGQPTLTWIEGDSTHAQLKWSQFRDDTWGEPRLISQGTDWFINSADFPALFASSATTWFAHWLRKSVSSTHAYNVMTAVSIDGGASWRAAGSPHRDGTPTEHGFVSFYRTLDGAGGMAWLDGRNTSGAHGAHSGAMTLRTATWGSSAAWEDSNELDPRVCDCCPTDAAMAESGPLVVYRDRSSEEIRDVALVRQVDGRWSQPIRVHADGWRIEGCPVNGPAIAARDRAVAVVWFTMAGEDAAVKVSESADGGYSFAAPLRLDQDQPLGRVDLGMLSDQRLIVSWLETDRFDETRIHLALLEAGEIIYRTQLGEAGATPDSGFPRLAVTIDDDVWLAWREQADNNSRLRSARVRFE